MHDFPELSHTPSCCQTNSVSLSILHLQAPTSKALFHLCAHMRPGPTWGEAPPFIPATPAVLKLRFRRFVLNQTEETVIRGLGPTQHAL